MMWNAVSRTDHCGTRRGIHDDSAEPWRRRLAAGPERPTESLRHPTASASASVDAASLDTASVDAASLDATSVDTASPAAERPRSPAATE